jgi:hypothetical protein
MTINFSLQTFPSLVVLSKGQKLKKDDLTDSEYKILTDFIELIGLDILEYNPIDLISVSFDNIGSVKAVYGPGFFLNPDNKDSFVLSVCNTLLNIEFVEGQKQTINGAELKPCFVGKPIDVTPNPDKPTEKIQLQPIAINIGTYQIPISQDLKNVFPQSEQSILFSAFLLGDRVSYDQFLTHLREPYSGGSFCKPADLKPGLYKVLGGEETNGKFGPQVNLSLSDDSGNQIKVWGNSYITEKYAVYMSGAVRKNVPLYLYRSGGKKLELSYVLDPSLVLEAA